VGSQQDYLSSTEHASSSTYYKKFVDGYFAPVDKNSAQYVRACRSFESGSGIYSLRDVGPAGGLIFYIDGTTYYEAAPTDQSTSKTYSNITTVSIGASAQGVLIGTGRTNTTAIIAQTGHTSSAAKLCNDLIL
jgi:hypothetical protein